METEEIEETEEPLVDENEEVDPLEENSAEVEEEEETIQNPTIISDE